VTKERWNSASAYSWSPHPDLVLALAAIPDDEAFDTLLDHANDKHALAALTQAVVAFPRRAGHLIGERVRAQGKNYKVVAPLMPASSDAGRPGAAGSKTALASASDLPTALVTPPWADAAARKKEAPAPITGISKLSHPASLVWEEGEKERFALHDWDPEALEPGGYLEELQKGKWAPPGPFTKWTEAQWNALTTDWEHHFKVVHAPEKISFAAAKWWAEHPKYYCPLPLAVVRYGMRMLPLVVEQAKRFPDKAVEHLGPFDAAELAPIVASVVHIKKVKSTTEGWLLRHPRATAVGLIPVAVGGSKDPQKAAIAGLQVLVRGGHEGVVREVASLYGDAVVAALDRLLGADPRLAKQPKAPAFWSPAKLPPVTLKSGGALPPAALDNLRVMLTLNELDRPFPRLAEVLAQCDRGSLAAFGWGIFEAWQRAGSPNDEKWALAALGVLGDDEVARKLTPLVRKWPGESAHVRATLGLDVLAAMGTDLALSSIHGIAEKLKFEALQELAKKHIAAIAKRRNLGVDELEDRLAPRLDLDPRGTMRLDYGGRTFTVGFDETLRPFVRDDSGKRLPDLPKPGAKDDAKVASRAQATFAALKKDVRAVGPNQIRRLERAMIAGRRWSGADFDAFLVRHPLVGHLVRSLVWGAYAGDALVATFRVAEDGALASIDDAAFALGGGQTVGLVHPLSLDEKTLARWGAVLSDYRILQPFPQLGRGRYATGDVEKAVKGATGKRVATSKVIGMVNFGWKRGAPQDSGHVGWMTRETTIGVLHLDLEDGFNVAALGETPEQTVGRITVGRSKPLDAKLLRALGDVEASELAHSLVVLVS
jgi:branched-subunit amino acid transport protein